jgi:hypothetical protein
MKMKDYYPKGGGGKTNPNNKKKKKQIHIKFFAKNICIAIMREQAKLKCLKEYLYCNDEIVIKSESSFETRKARTIDRTLDSIVPEMGNIPYYARPELTQNFGNHVCIKESKMYITKKNKLESPVNYILIVKILQTMQNLSRIGRYLGILESVRLIEVSKRTFGHKLNKDIQLGFILH